MDLFSSLVAIADTFSATLGVTDLAPFPEQAEQIRTLVAQGFHGGLAFTYAEPEKAATPAQSFPWASSIVVVAIPYLVDGDGEDEERTVARFADGDRYVRLTALLEALKERLDDDGHRNETVFDDDRLIDRAVAVRSGVAWHGKSTMVLTPGAGPWILIGSVVTSADLTSTEPMERSCGTCDACMPACPTGAIVTPGVLDARRCIAAVLQRRGAIDPALRTAIGGRIYGCDDCLTSCPPGRPLLTKLEPSSDTLRPETLLSLSDLELEAMVEHWYVPSRQMRFLRRNALVALGNTGDESSLGLLSGYVGHPDPMLAGHALWAVGRIGGSRATAICVAALAGKPESSVRDELEAAVTASRRGGVYADGPSISAAEVWEG